ncbi:MAG: hypothetical protein NTX76_03630 [Alphaproteobacteria bacterium]|nr:hypothetical protein [Alphaproteobacteria bacterium]
MPIIYRAIKGAPLTIEEMDENFAQLERRIAILETTPPNAEGIKEVRQAGEQITVMGTSGGVLGVVSLPKFLPVPRGEWQGNTRYFYGDWVTTGRALYFCTAHHMSAVFVEQKEFWQILLQGD